MSVSDAVILLVADGLVAVGRVLRGLRRPSGAEVRAQAVGEADRLSEREAVIDSWEPDELWVPDGPSAFVWPESVGPKHGLTCRSCEGDIATCGCWDDDEPESDPVRSAAVSPPAADNTTDANHLEDAWYYHRGAVGYSTTMDSPVWICEGCDWTGPTEQAHARHRFHVLADMKAATHRIQEQLGGAS